MTRRIGALAILAALAWGAEAMAANLSDTALFTKIAHDCHTVDLIKWRHPTRDVLQAAEIRIEGVQLCNDGKFPVFTVAPKYDPRTATGDYYHKLYAKLAEANGWWSYALIDTVDNVVVEIKPRKQPRALDIDYEDFQ